MQCDGPRLFPSRLADAWVPSADEAMIDVRRLADYPFPRHAVKQKSCTITMSCQRCAHNDRSLGSPFSSGTRRRREFTVSYTIDAPRGSDLAVLDGLTDEDLRDEIVARMATLPPGASPEGSGPVMAALLVREVRRAVAAVEAYWTNPFTSPITTM